MPSLKDLVSVIGSGKGNMSKDMELDSKIKEEAIKKVDEARDMISEEGVDGTQFILNHLSGERAVVEQSQKKDDDSRSDRKRAAIILIKRKMGVEE